MPSRRLYGAPDVDCDLVCVRPVEPDRGGSIHVEVGHRHVHQRRPPVDDLLALEHDPVRPPRHFGGVTIFLTTQYLEEADQLADRIAVLDGGRIVAEGTAAELKRLVPGGHVRLQLPDAATMAEVTRRSRRHGGGRLAHGGHPARRQPPLAA